MQNEHVCVRITSNERHLFKTLRKKVWVGTNVVIQYLILRKLLLYNTFSIRNPHSFSYCSKAFTAVIGRLWEPYIMSSSVFYLDVMTCGASTTRACAGTYSTNFTRITLSQSNSYNLNLFIWPNQGSLLCLFFIPNSHHSSVVYTISWFLAIINYMKKTSLYLCLQARFLQYSQAHCTYRIWATLVSSFHQSNHLAQLTSYFIQLIFKVPKSIRFVRIKWNSPELIDWTIKIYHPSLF